MPNGYAAQGQSSFGFGYNGGYGPFGYGGMYGPWGLGWSEMDMAYTVDVQSLTGVAIRYAASDSTP